MRNTEIGAYLSRLADLLEIEGAGSFRVRAYRTAADALAELPRPVADMVRAGEDLSNLEGIGESIAGKIEEIVRTGRLKQLEELESRYPASLAGLLSAPGLGPKRVRTLYDELGVRDLDGLEKAVQQGRLRSLSGFGQKLEGDLLRYLEHYQGETGRMLWAEVEPAARALEEYIRQAAGVEQAAAAGSYRRRRETAGDLDLVASARDSGPVIDHFTKFEEIERIVSKGETRSTVVLRSGLQVDLRVVDPESYGAALFYFTGSREHNLALRNEAIKRGLKINEYGVFQDDERIGGETEEEFYKIFDLPYIEPELREERGEFEAAREGRLPVLVEPEQVRGDLQMHTTASDGRASVEEMARAAKALGYAYIAMTDHASSIGVLGGVGAEVLARQADEIDRLNARLKGITILKGVEVDIHEDGSLFLPDEVLEKMDIVLVAVHSHFNLSRKAQTARVVRALENPHVRVFAHPTGRRIGERAPIDLDLEQVFRTAVKNGVWMEVNANPIRLDLDDVACKLGKEMGARFVIGSDAHSPEELERLRFGVYQARRGWLETGDVANTLPLKALLKALDQKKG